MRKMIALFVSTAFLIGTTGLAVAQTSTAPAPAAPTQEKKMEDKATEKKPPTKKSMTMEEKKAACMQKAGTDATKQGNCEKQYSKQMEKMDKKEAPTPEKK